jgi:lipopolysaccharide exporter
MKGEIAKGAAWMVLFRLFDRSIGLVSTAVLARLLLPADFGLVAMAMSVIALIELATAFSFELALIQKKDPQREHYDSAWTLNIIVAVGGGIVTAAVALPVASFYGDPRLTPVMFAIGAAWLVSGFENIGTVNFRRNMDFAAEFRLLATKRVISFLVTMVAAVTFRSYWSLVIGMATGRVTGVALSYLLQPFRPRLSLGKAGELFSFSGWMLVSNFATVLLSRVPHIYVGRMFGAQTLGAYTVGSEIAQLAHTELVAPINRAMFPGYSRLTGDLALFRRTAVDATAAILLVVMPVSVGVAVLAAQVVRILLGAQWPEAAPVIEVLAFSGAVSALTSNNMSAYQALGRPHLCTVTLLARLLLVVGMMLFLGSSLGVLGVAYAELIAALGSLAVSVPILSRTLQMPLREYWSCLWRPTIASCLMGAVIYLQMPHGQGELSFVQAVAQLVIGIVLGVLSYPLFVWLLWWLSGKPESVEVLITRRLLLPLLGRLRGAK